MPQPQNTLMSTFFSFLRWQCYISISASTVYVLITTMRCDRVSSVAFMRPKWIRSHIDPKNQPILKICFKSKKISGDPEIFSKPKEK